MKLLSLGMTGTTEEIRQKLQQDCNIFAREGCKLSVDELQLGGYTFLSCNIPDGEISYRSYERVKNLLKVYIAQILSDMIIIREEKNIVHDILRQDYEYFSGEEQNQIITKVFDILHNDRIMTEYSLTVRRSRIFTKMLDYLNGHNEMVLDGFIRFRLKEYRQLLASAVEQAVDEFMSDVEYQEFIRILRYFVSMQEPRFGEVHVVVDKNNVVYIFDADGEILNDQDGEQFTVNTQDGTHDQDLLMSALITVAPQMIIFHFASKVKNKELVATVQEVFTERVFVCDGCRICNVDLTPNRKSGSNPVDT
ncbi:putative sporulation protein YtxC [Acetonema longum]|uniref:Sporulation protein YtxC n=1 Tax=Acetonema longum DSM 6540 TaxID=1009370 RepID=F7NNG5_9FIRM|nr:putative sporulation protein YtxC [Acetonema longum]EGO62406.1 sporulation protein YtxC [Acetonema longum DSM 6540]